MPRTVSQCKLIKDQRLESIIECATYLFATKQYKSITVDDITNTVKCSHGLFYHYFSSKETLFHAVMASSVSITKDIINSVSLINLNPVERLSTIICNILDALKNKDDNIVCSLYLLFNLSLQKNDIPKPSKKPDDIPFQILLLNTIIDGQQKNLFLSGDARSYMITLLATLKGLTYNRLFVGHTKFICPTVDILMNLVVIK